MTFKELRGVLGSSERNYCPNCGSKNKINYLLNWDDMPLKEKSDD